MRKAVMWTKNSMRWLAVLTAVSVLALGRAQAQGSCTFTDESGKTVTWPNCQDPNATKAAGDKAAPPTAAPAKTPSAPPAVNSFAFPGEPVAPAASSGGTTPGTAAPGQNGYPFPSETPAGSDAKAAPPNGSGLNDAGSSGSSSSSSSSSSGVPFDDPQAGPLADTDDDSAAKSAAKRRAERKRLAAPKELTGDDREEEDLRVAAFYLNDNNFRGSYMRATDAVSIDAEDPEARFALAEAARRLGKLDEALTNYKKCLTLDPVPKTKKAAEKAVKDMQGGQRSTLMP